MNNNLRLKADLSLIFVTLGWGISYFIVDLCLTELAPVTINLYRFMIPFIFSIIIFRKKMKNISKNTIKYATICSIFISITYYIASVGLTYTSQSNEAFLISLTVVFTPIIDHFFNKRKISRKLFLCLMVCIIGTALLTINENFSVSSKHFFGDMICIFAGLTYAIFIVITDYALNKHDDIDSLQLGIIELGITGAIFLLISILLVPPTLPKTTGIWFAILFLGIVGTGVANIVQNWAQNHTSASHVGLIYSLEPVFAALTAYFFADEILSTQGYIGASLMFLSVIFMEINIKKIVKRGLSKK